MHGGQGLVYIFLAARAHLVKVLRLDVGGGMRQRELFEVVGIGAVEPRRCEHVLDQCQIGRADGLHVQVRRPACVDSAALRVDFNKLHAA